MHHPVTAQATRSCQQCRAATEVNANLNDRRGEIAQREARKRHCPSVITDGPAGDCARGRDEVVDPGVEGHAAVRRYEFHHGAIG